MYHFLSVLAGVFVAVMILVNGELSSFYGVYSSTVVIHIVGILLVFVILAVKREKLYPVKKQSLHLYLGGAIGVANVVFCNLAFGRISISAILALGLLGQTLTSLMFDRYGFLNMPKHPFMKMKLIGIGFVLLGIVLMLVNSKVDAIVPIIVSLLTGVSTVTSRTLNASLANKTSAMNSTLFNYIVGLSVSAVILIIAGNQEPMMLKFSLSPNVWIYMGGIIGVGVVTLLNVAVCKIPSFYMTLLLFSGQVFSGVVIDILLTNSFSLNNFIGGVAITLGLAQNLWIDKRGARAVSPCPQS